MAKYIKIKYLDKRPIYFPRLANYPGGLALPNDNNEIQVTEKEWKHLKQEKNGNKFCYEEIKPNKVEKVETPIVEQEA
jgi:hypothetical protein